MKIQETLKDLHTVLEMNLVSGQGVGSDCPSDNSLLHRGEAGLADLAAWDQLHLHWAGKGLPRRMIQREEKGYLLSMTTIRDMRMQGKLYNIPMMRMHKISKDLTDFGGDLAAILELINLGKIHIDRFAAK